MKKITKKSILQKITISILSIMLLFNFIVPTYSHALDATILADPVCDFVAFLGDILMGIVQGALNLSAGEKFSAGDSTFMVDVGDFDAKNAASDEKFSTDGTEALKEDIDTSNLNLGGHGKEYQIPMSSLSPEEIFAGKVAALDINFINPDKDYWGTTKDKAGNEIAATTSGQLQRTIASWYVALRNLAVVGLLSILVYVGIRIILSSTAGDKAKYKQLLKDWLVALCLLFFMHYLMSFIITLTESICTAIVGDSNGNIAVNVTGSPAKSFKTNLMGLARFQVQRKTLLEKGSYLVIYAFLVYYTIMFAWKYLKRMIMMAFLTIISPLVVLTYPIDKMNDGQAQAFNAWLKEYIYNALLQPFHLVIYYIFVLSAMDLAANNIVYTIVVMWFIPKAEEQLRNFFGFNKAPSLGNTMAGFAGGLGFSKLLQGGGSKGKGSSGGGSSKEENDQIHFDKKSTGVDELPDGSDKPKDNEEAGIGKEENEGKVGFKESIGNGAKKIGRKIKNAPKSAASAASKFGNWAKDTPGRLKRNAGNVKRKAGNWVNGHGGLGKMAIKGFAGAAKFGTKRVFKLAGAAGGAALGATLGAAQGKGISGMLGGAAIGMKAGANLGKTASGALNGAVGAVGTAGRNASARLRREIDLANGNSARQNAAAMKGMKKDEKNVASVRKYLRDKNGVEPSAKDVKDQMNKFNPYFERGETDIDEIIKSHKTAEKMNLSDEQAAVITAVGKKNNITADRLKDKGKSEQDYNDLVYQLKGKNVSEAEARRRASFAMDFLKEREGIRNNGGKVVQNGSAQNNNNGKNKVGGNKGKAGGKKKKGKK